MCIHIYIYDVMMCILYIYIHICIFRYACLYVLRRAPTIFLIPCFRLNVCCHWVAGGKCYANRLLL